MSPPRPRPRSPAAAATLSAATTPSAAPPSNVRVRTVDDPLALRALAHPIRLELQTLVAREGSLTAADAARQLGISHGLASHHLRQLAKYGFIERATAVGNRDHPWRVTSTSMDIRADGPEGRAPKDFLERHSVERAGAQLADWQQRRDQEDPDWAELAGVTAGLVYLTPDELSEALRAWSAIVSPLAARRPVGHAGRRPPGATPVSITLVAVPLPRTEHGG